MKHVVSFQDFVGKTRNFFYLKPGQIWQRRGIYLTQDFGPKWNLTLEICSLVNCLSPVKAEQYIFSNNGLFMDGRKRISETS